MHTVPRYTSYNRARANNNNTHNIQIQKGISDDRDTINATTITSATHTGGNTISVGGNIYRNYGYQGTLCSEMRENEEHPQPAKPLYSCNTSNNRDAHTYVDRRSMQLQEEPYYPLEHCNTGHMIWQLEYACCYTEALRRYIVELESDNSLLRIALVEAAERRTRERLQSHNSYIVTNSKSHNNNNNNNNNNSDGDSNKRESKNGCNANGSHAMKWRVGPVLEECRMHMEVLERTARHCIEQELHTLQKRHTEEIQHMQEQQCRQQEGEVPSLCLRGGCYEANLSLSERRRWREHIQHTLEELALLHREMERHAIGGKGMMSTTKSSQATPDNAVNTTTTTTTNNNNNSNNNDSTTSNNMNNKSDMVATLTARVAELEAEVVHWKEAATTERERVSFYQQGALKELRRMHAVYQHALTENRTTAKESVITTTTPNKGTYHEMQLQRKETSTTVSFSFPVVSTSSIEMRRVRTEEEEKKGNVSVPHGAPHDPLATTHTSIHSSTLEGNATTSTSAFSAPAMPAAVPTPGDVTRETWARYYHSYHSDTYLQGENVANDVDGASAL